MKRNTSTKNWHYLPFSIPLTTKRFCSQSYRVRKSLCIFSVDKSKHILTSATFLFRLLSGVSRCPVGALCTRSRACRLVSERSCETSGLPAFCSPAARRGSPGSGRSHQVQNSCRRHKWCTKEEIALKNTFYSWNSCLANLSVCPVFYFYLFFTFSGFKFKISMIFNYVFIFLTMWTLAVTIWRFVLLLHLQLFCQIFFSELLYILCFFKCRSSGSDLEKNKRTNKNKTGTSTCETLSF